MVDSPETAEASDGETDAGPSGGGDAGGATSRAPHWRQLHLAGIVVLGLWLVGLVVFSTLIYRSFFLSEDFATYNQAWIGIAHGRLNPLDTIYQISFVKADFELIIWPLALVHFVFPQPVVLLYVQDLAAAGCGLVTYLWILEFLERQRLPRSPAILVASAVLVVTVVDPGIYQAVGFDLHMEPIATLFLLLAARDLWRGRIGRAWWWIAAVLLCGSFAAIMVVGLGISALLAGRSTRWPGIGLIAAGMAWTALISVLHADGGSDITNFAYLAGRASIPAGGVMLVVTGVLGHPGRALHNLYIRYPYMWLHIRAAGIVGLASAWGFGVPAVVMLVNGLDSHLNFSRSAFQNFAVLPFVLVGTVMVLVWLSEHVHRGQLVAVVVAVLVLGEAVTFGIEQSPQAIRQTLAEVQAGPAAALGTALAKTPANAEVVSTMGVMGRFSSREYCYFFERYRNLPVHGNTVVFVFSTSNLELISAAGMQLAITYVRENLHAQPLVDTAGVTAFLWHPPAGTSGVRIPTVPAVTP